MVVDKDTLAKTYADKSDDELLELYASGTLSEIANEVINIEANKRGWKFPKRPTEKLGSTDLSFVKSEATNYGTVRVLSQLIIFLGWTTVIVSLAFVVIGILNLTGGGWSISNALTLQAPILAIAISGLATVVAGQVLRATIDTADNTRKILIHLISSE